MFTWILTILAAGKMIDWHDDWKYRRCIARAKLKEEWEKKRAKQTPRQAKRENIFAFIFMAVILSPFIYFVLRIIIICF